MGTRRAVRRAPSFRSANGGPAGRADFSGTQSAHRAEDVARDVLTDQPIGRHGAVVYRGGRPDPAKAYIRRRWRHRWHSDPVGERVVALPPDRQAVAAALREAKNAMGQRLLPGLLAAILVERQVPVDRLRALVAERFGAVPRESDMLALAWEAESHVEARMTQRFGWLPKYQLRWIGLV